MTLRAKLIPLAVALASVTCSSPFERACTLIGCAGALRIHLATLPSGPFRVEVRVPGSTAVVFAYACTTNCTQTILTEDVTATDVRVTVYVGSNSLDTSVSGISYIVSTPNGPGCGECRQATITVPIPS